MAALQTTLNLHGVDDVYERLLALHDGRTLEDSFRIAARLNLILINHVGDRAVIDQAFACAARPLTPAPAEAGASDPASEGEQS